MIVLIFTIGILPRVFQSTNGSEGFIWIVNLIGIVSICALSYLQPRKLTLVIDCHGVSILDSRDRVLVAKPLSDVERVELGRWGHVLKFPICWIILKVKGSSKPLYIGPVSCYQIDPEFIFSLQDCLVDTKAEQAAPSNR